LGERLNGDHESCCSWENWKSTTDYAVRFRFRSWSDCCCLRRAGRKQSNIIVRSGGMALDRWPFWWTDATVGDRKTSSGNLVHGQGRRAGGFWSGAEQGIAIFSTGVRFDAVHLHCVLCPCYFFGPGGKDPVRGGLAESGDFACWLLSCGRAQLCRLMAMYLLSAEDDIRPTANEGETFFFQMGDSSPISTVV